MCGVTFNLTVNSSTEVRSVICVAQLSFQVLLILTYFV